MASGLHAGSHTGASLRPWLPYVLCLQLVFWLAVGLFCFSFIGSNDIGDGVARSSGQAASLKEDANMVKLDTLKGPLPGGDKRGWIMSPMLLAEKLTLAGGALSCRDVHAGTVLPGAQRGNHRHHTKNETFLVWGAKAFWRIENAKLREGYSHVIVKAHEMAVFTGPRERAHGLGNLDTKRTLNLIVCADADWDPEKPDTDYHVWTDL
eukprot:TRINITY_DN39581_c0_g1_i1.p1 TRINITY_DN39581_c0_g1~~TRINITY_DN39581_c0_g1_i1.p1  ORF type:complete len:208 (+),score=28.58 TRINITY_DN39581_c0_g1_i1:305-928(+)